MSLSIFAVCDLVTHHAFAIDIPVVSLIDIIACALGIVLSGADGALIVDAVTSYTFAIHLWFSAGNFGAYHIIAKRSIVVNERCGTATKDKKYESE